MTDAYESIAQPFRQRDPHPDVPLMTARMSEVERVTAFDEYGDTSWLEIDTNDEALNQCNRGRLAAHARGDWFEIGIAARVTFLIPFGSSAIMQTVTSPGVWGVASNENQAYLDELFGEERENLATMLKALGVTVIDDATAYRRTPKGNQKGHTPAREREQDP